MNNHEHYWEVFSGACCKVHGTLRIFVYAMVLPLFQQITPLIYEHWINSFVTYWKEKSSFITRKKKETTKKHCNKCDHCIVKKLGDDVCVYCSKNVQNLVKLDELKCKVDKVARHSRTLVASTENLLMPLIQLAFIFPCIVTNIFSERINNTVSTTEENILKKIINEVSSNWTVILITSSTISSLVSLASSQTSIYFSSPGKQTQKTLTTRTIIFTVILLQVVPKVLACQAFVFGVIKYPDAILPVFFILPCLSSVFKSLLIWLASGCSLTWKSLWRLNLSPFIFRRIDRRIRAMDNPSSSGNVSKITQNGKYHVIFDILSMLENSAFVFSGSFGIKQIEKSFKMELFCGVVLGTHLLGLILKAFFYRYQHPWMSLSRAYKGMGLILNMILILLGLMIVISMPLIGYFLVHDETTSTIFYILTGLAIALVNFNDRFHAQKHFFMPNISIFRVSLSLITF